MTLTRKFSSLPTDGRKLVYDPPVLIWAPIPRHPGTCAARLSLDLVEVQKCPTVCIKWLDTDLSRFAG